MIRTLSYFPDQCAKNSAPVLQAFLESCRRAGIAVRPNSQDCDAAVIWSVLWSGRMSANQQVWSHYRNTGRPVIIVDVGALYRGETWKIAVNNITADGYYGHTENLDWNRPRKLGISQAINLSRNPRIVIAAQHACSLQVAQLESMENWIQQQITQLQKITDRPIVIRPHPRSALDPDWIKILPATVTMEKPVRVENTYDSYNLAFDCHAMINYNSGPGIQAALAGTRPMVDPSSLASPVSVSSHDLELPYKVDRDRWLVEICHSEYTLQEIGQGTWISRLASVLEQPHG